MNTSEAIAHTYSIMKMWELQGWRVRLIAASMHKSKKGECRYRTKEIALALDHIQQSPDDDIHETIIHEIAHAIVGAKARPAHGREWRLQYAKMGGTGKATYRIELQ